MARKKPYDDGCATAHALDLIGERWGLLIVRELVPGPARFSDLKAALPGISSNILTTRLTEMEAGHVLTRRRLPPPAASQVYELTRWGAELEPLIRNLGRWAARSPTMQPGKPMSAASLMLSFRTMFDAEAAHGFNARLAITLGERAHVATVADGSFEIVPGDTNEADAAISGDPNLLAGFVYGDLSLDDAIERGLLISGDRAKIERFATLFPLPDRAPCTAT